MAKRPAAVALVAGALFVLGAPAAAAGQESPAPVLQGHAEWTLDAAGVTLDVTAPAARTAAGRASFPALGGDADPEAGFAEVELGGAARLGGPAGRPLVLAGLRLRLTGDGGALHARTVVDGRARELALAEVSDAAPAVRATGAAWTGLRASLSAEGAALLSSWSGTAFTAGDAFGAFEVTVGTGGADATGDPGGTSGAGGSGAAPGAPQASPDAGQRPGTAAREEKPAAALARPALAAGAEQTVTGTGFAPGAVVLVAIDGDTRYQAVADARGRFERSFPVYVNAAEGEHTVELTAVGAHEGVAGARFGVGSPD